MPRPLTLQFSWLSSLAHWVQLVLHLRPFQSTLLTPGRLKPATLRTWGVGTGFIKLEQLERTGSISYGGLHS